MMESGGKAEGGGNMTNRTEEQPNNRYHLDKSYFQDPLRAGHFEIIQVGRLYFYTGGRMERHIHRNWFEVTVVTSGEGTVYTNGEEVPVRQNDIFLSFPTDSHGISSNRDTQMEYDFFAFNTTDPVLSKELDHIVQNHMAPSDRVIRDERIGFAVSNLIHEVDRVEPLSEQLLENLCSQVVIYLVRAFRGRSPSPAKTAAYGSKQDILSYQIRQYISSHVFSLKNLNELSGIFNYNYSYLSDVFRKSTGQSLQSYFNSKRLETARRLLAEDKISITRVSESLNYSTVQNFSRAYKKKYGVPPSTR